MEKKYEILPHTADLHIRAYGNTLPELFANMLTGMFEAIEPMVGDRKTVREISVQAHDRETLLIDFLSEALYLSDVHKEVYLNVEITDMSDTHIVCTLHGTGIRGFESGEIKAVTYHGLKVERRDGDWVAEVLFDL